MLKITLVKQTTALPHHLQYQEFQVQSYLKNQEVVPVDNIKIKLNYLMQGNLSMFFYKYYNKAPIQHSLQSSRLKNQDDQKQHFLTLKSQEQFNSKFLFQYWCIIRKTGDKYKESFQLKCIILMLTSPSQNWYLKNWLLTITAKDLSKQDFRRNFLFTNQF